MKSINVNIKIYSKDSCKKSDVLEAFSLDDSAPSLSSGLDECANIFRSRGNISRLCVDFGSAVKGRGRSSVRERLGRKKNRFINSIRFPLHFSSVLRLRLRSCPEITPRPPSPLSTSASTRANPAYSLDPVPFRFSLSRPISAEDIRSAIRARNLNKTNQYSNPPLSLADSPGVPFSALFSRLFSFLLYLFLFISIFPPLLSDTFVFSVSFSFAPILHSLTISKRPIYSHLSAESDDLLSRSFQPLYSLDFNSPNDWFYTWRTFSFHLPGRRKNIR